MANDDELIYLSVEEPCSQSWDSMKGTDVVRHCRECNLNVYNITAMTSSQAKELINKTEDRLCVRFFKRADGTVLTQDCSELRPKGFLEKLLNKFIPLPPQSPPDSQQLCDGPTAKTADQAFMGKLVQVSRVVIATRDIKENQLIAADDICLTTVEPNAVPPGSTANVYDVFKHKSRRKIAKSEVILLTDVY